MTYEIAPKNIYGVIELNRIPIIKAPGAAGNMPYAAAKIADMYKKDSNLYQNKEKGPLQDIYFHPDTYAEDLKKEEIKLVDNDGLKKIIDSVKISQN